MDGLNEFLLFTDGSVDAHSGTGYGAFLIVSSPFPTMDQIKRQIRIKKFEQTSSSQLELQTLLWALGEIYPDEKKIIVYTDSQLINGLKERREKLEEKAFQTGKNKIHKNAPLYREFFRIIDRMEIELVKIKGHKKKVNRSEIDALFSLVDQAARKALKQ